MSEIVLIVIVAALWGVMVGVVLMAAITFWITRHRAGDDDGEENGEEDDLRPDQR